MQMRHMKYFFSFLLLVTSAYLQAGDYLRIDSEKKFETLGFTTHPIISVRQYKEFPATNGPRLKVVEANVIFKNGTIFFGFGLPNVYLARITKHGEFRKYSAKFCYRAPSTIEKTDGRTQSGFFLVPTSFPEDLQKKIITIARAQEGSKNITCAQANASILHQAGCVIGDGKRFDEYDFPSPLFRDLIEKGLSCDGKKIEFDIVASTPLSLSEFYKKIQEQEKILATLVRKGEEYFDRDDAKSLRREEAKIIKAENAKNVIPISEKKSENSFTVSIGQTSHLGTFLRNKWGKAHVLYQVSLNDQQTRPDQFLTHILTAFPQKNPSLVTSIKKNLIFSPEAVSIMHNNMANSFKEIKVSDEDFMNNVKTHTSAQPNKYNFVITDEFIAFMHLQDNGWITWTLSKHAGIANYSKTVRFAGEFWKDEQNKIHINNNSGTYQPKSSDVPNAVKFFKALMPNIEIIGEEHVQ